MIPVKIEQNRDPPYERCCFCRARTKYWTNLDSRSAAQQVACCTKCAKYGYPEDVITKYVWFRREAIADATVSTSLKPPKLHEVVWHHRGEK